MQVAGHMYAVKRGFESRATPAHEKPPALPEDHLFCVLVSVGFEIRCQIIDEPAEKFTCLIQISGVDDFQG